ncbi:DnaA regulatory inactivator Hda [Agitococcus lubricus]|uniref:Regulatory inactivation of DnaA Hda protein n=1 Tax=Agitococcus lubricus TaxID=1077255 RepID=A0A2T5IZ61_9GAMM|nr:DnaA regulatory inactivator Hda [Agitococcus lubricus]PTQ89295.1 regulatory inactivation of DnaA Hda protein [Agitococcus lubricus]
MGKEQTLIEHLRSKQLLLNLGPRLDARLSDFSGPSWAEIISAIEQLFAGTIQRCFIYGEPNTGKTHLLAAACQAYSERQHSTLLLSLRELTRSHQPDALQYLEHHDLITLDDIEIIVDLREWQEALFHLLNRAQQNDTRLILAARASPSQLGLVIPDLISRLQQAACYRIPNGDNDADRQAVLQAALGRRNLALDPEIIKYLLIKGPRYIGLLLKHLTYLEESSIRQRKRLTLNFVKQLTEK